MEINRTGSQPSRPGPPDYFTGTARPGPLFEAPPPPDPARVLGVSVTFNPGARTARHLIWTPGLRLCEAPDVACTSRNPWKDRP